MRQRLPIALLGLILLLASSILPSPASAAPSPIAAAADEPNCTAGDVTAVAPVLVERGTLTGSIVVTNISGGICTVQGMPSVRVVDVHAAALAVSQVNAPGPSPVVTLQPYQRAEVPVTWANFCQPAPAFPVSLEMSLPGPGTATALLLSPGGTRYDTTPVCVAPGTPSTLTVGPFAGLANGTTFYFAEGSTQSPFDTWFLIQNPTTSPTNVVFTFQLAGGGSVARTYVVGPTSRFSLYANQVLPNAAFSTRVDADQPILAERSMFVGFEGDVVPGVRAPSRSWLFAEGSTQSPFQTWLLLQNPNPVPATATISYLLNGGGTPVNQDLNLPPTSRTSVFVNQVLPNAAFSTRVASDEPIVVERAMYRFPGNAATTKAGVNQPSQTWSFAMGNSEYLRGQPADTWLLLQNPNATPVTATVTVYGFAPSGETPRTFPYTLAPTSRQSIFLSQIAPYLVYGIQVQASADIIAERSVFVSQNAYRVEPRGVFATFGAPQLGTVWAFAEGSTAPPFHESLAVLNPNPQPMTAHFEFMLPNGQVTTFDETVPADSRSALAVDDFAANTAVSARVSTSLPSVVERIMTWVKDGNQGFSDTVGFRSQ